MTETMTAKDARLAMPNGFKFRKVNGSDEYKLTMPDGATYFTDDLSDVVGTAQFEFNRTKPILTKFQRRQNKVRDMISMIQRANPNFASALTKSYPTDREYDLVIAENFISLVNMGLLCELANLED